MSATLAPTPATTASGDTVDIPPYVDPVAWAEFVAAVAILPHGGCHIWLGDHVRGRSVWRGRPLLPGADVPRDTPAHALATMAWLGSSIDFDPGQPQAVHHACGEPLCVPVTRAAVLEHLSLSECPTTRRRTGSHDAVREAVRSALGDQHELVRAYRRACEAHRPPAQAAPGDGALF